MDQRIGDGRVFQTTGDDLREIAEVIEFRLADDGNLRVASRSNEKQTFSPELVTLARTAPARAHGTGAGGHSEARPAGITRHARLAGTTRDRTGGEPRAKTVRRQMKEH